MAKDLPAETPKVPTDHAGKIVEAAMKATVAWLKGAGKIEQSHDLDVTRKFSDYGVSPDEFSRLSGVVISRVRLSTGKALKLPPDLARHYHQAPISDFITALPGRPTIPSSGPMRSAYSPLAGRPQTPSSGPIGKRRGK
jgi:hypothetical protein